MVPQGNQNFAIIDIYHYRHIKVVPLQECNGNIAIQKNNGLSGM